MKEIQEQQRNNKNPITGHTVEWQSKKNSILAFAIIYQDNLKENQGLNTEHGLGCSFQNFFDQISHYVKKIQLKN